MQMPAKNFIITRCMPTVTINANSEKQFFRVTKGGGGVAGLWVIFRPMLALHDGEVTGVTSGVTSELHVTFVTCNSLVTHL